MLRFMKTRRPSQSIRFPSKRCSGDVVLVSHHSYLLLTDHDVIVLNPKEGNLKGKAAFLPGALAVGMIIWTWFRLPETKDITPGALDRLFQSRTHTRKFVEESKKYQ